LPGSSIPARDRPAWFLGPRSAVSRGWTFKHPHEWDEDTAASIAAIEVVTRSLGDGVVEYVRKIELWDKGKALEHLST
jgi:hypothetical protein